MTAPSASENKIMKDGNLAAIAKGITDETVFELYCVGYFVNTACRYIDSRLYAVDYTKPNGYQVYLTSASLSHG